MSRPKPFPRPKPIRFANPEAEKVSASAVATLSDVLNKYDVIEVVENDGNPFMIVSERTKGSSEAWFGSEVDVPQFFKEPSAGERAGGATVVQIGKDDVKKLAGQDYPSTYPYSGYGRNKVSIQEIGSSSPSPFTSFVRREYNNDLLGLKGLRAYDKMRRNDATIRGTLRAIKTPVLSARWFIKPDDPAVVQDVNGADFVWKNLTKYQSLAWTQTLTEALLMCDFGYYMFEIVWDDTIFEGKEHIMLKKLAPRHPMDVIQWEYDYNGGPVGAWMWGDPTNVNSTDTFMGVLQNKVFIPMEKLLVFTFDREAGNIEGISVLRSAYKHWYYIEQLYKIDAIQKERHGIGVPVIKLPVGFNDDDKRLADEIGRNLRTNERAHVAIPPLWDIIFAELKGQPVDALKSVAIHQQAVRENILLTFMESGTASSEEDQMLFLKATRFIADIACDTFNKYLIPKLIDANFTRIGYPELKARRIGEQADWRTLSFAIRNLIGSGALVPDDPLEEMLRDEMDLPEIDFKTRRVVATPQNRSDIPNQPDIGFDSNVPGEGDVPGAGTTQNGLVVSGAKQKGSTAGMPKQRTGPPAAYQMRRNAGRDNSGG